MPRLFASRANCGRVIHHRPQRDQATTARRMLAIACLVVSPSLGFAQGFEDPGSGDRSPSVESSDLPMGDPGLEFASLPDDDSLSCDAGLFDPNLLESDRYAADRLNADRHTFWSRVVSDHRNYYDLHSFRLLASGFLVGAAIANTQLDQELHDHFQSSVGGASSDDWSEFLHADKELGNGMYTLPIFATAWAVGAFFDESPVLVTTSDWGERSLRSFLVGAPPLMLAQRLTGASRPRENDHSSQWAPFQDNNGVSGHAFMASLPFINAAKMTDNRWLKTTFYAGSLLGPLSRVNDGAHYPSQVALGWWMAYVAASAIDRTQQASGRVQFYPYAAADGYGGLFEFQF